MHWESQEEYLRILRKFPKDEVCILIKHDVTENVSRMLLVAELLKDVKSAKPDLTKWDDGDLEIVNMLIEAVLTHCPNILTIIRAANEHFEASGNT